MPSDYVSFLLCLVSLQFLSPTPLVTFSNSWHWVLPGPSCDHWIGTSLQVPSRGISGSTAGCNASLLTEYIHCSVVMLPLTAPNHSSTQVDQQAPSCTDPIQALAVNLWLQWLYLAQKMRFFRSSSYLLAHTFVLSFHPWCSLNFGGDYYRCLN